MSALVAFCGVKLCFQRGLIHGFASYSAILHVFNRWISITFVYEWYGVWFCCSGPSYSRAAFVLLHSLVNRMNRLGRYVVVPFGASEEKEVQRFQLRFGWS